jgi:ATP-dependent DNA helicase RecG
MAGQRKSDSPDLDIQYIKGVGPKRAALLRSRLNIHTVSDALYYLPFRYEDRGNPVSMRDLRPDTMQTVSGTVVSADVIDLKHHGRKVTDPRKFRPVKGLLFELSLADGTGFIKGKWFQQPYLATKYRKGMKVILSGVVRHPRYGTVYEMDNPSHESLGDDSGSIEDTVHTNRITPVYRTTEEISPKLLRTIIHNALSGAGELKDPMPGEIINEQGLPGLDESIRSAHSPPEGTDIDLLNSWATPWQQRLSFDELFMLEAGFAVLKRGKLTEKGRVFAPEGKHFKRLLAALPFSLTAAQERVIKEILDDMRRPLPMQRLLQGDVGAGKTIVALSAMLTAVESGAQSALMAPTEILAEQHYINIHSMVESLGLSICLITGSRKDRPLEAIATGEMDIVVGTHALIQDEVRFKDLGLAVIDEQHRFGVQQRALLRKKARMPDVLIMTATPIPRTLALTLYGDLDYSVLDEMPPGRTPVDTRMYVDPDRRRIFKTVDDEIKEGGQVYVVYPLVEETEKSDLMSATEAAGEFREKLPGLNVALIHGRMKPAEKEESMKGFKAGKIDILVSTTVIEVGVDVPNASLMLIEHSERFGLSQLHQLRGRVGRGARASRCILLAYGRLGEESTRRLEVMCMTNDGFRIAEEDLALRGPGEFLGTRQSGLPDLRVANIIRDARLFEPARAAAFALLANDPELRTCPDLKKALEGFWRGKVDLFRTG